MVTPAVGLLILSADLPSAIPEGIPAGWLAGGGGALVVLYPFVKPFLDAWSTKIKHRLGDSETEKKEKTRHMVHDLTEMMGKVVDQMERLADCVKGIQDSNRDFAESVRSIHKEVEESRRELRDGLERLERDR